MIYSLLDFDLLNKYHISFEEFTSKAKELNSSILQYRNKHSSKKEVILHLKKLRNLWDKTLIVNDYVDLVEYCDGVHIGQEDLQNYHLIDNIKKHIGNKLIGLSTHNKEEVLKANKMDIDYIGLGAFRQSDTKNVTSIKGKELLEIAKLSKHDVAIIGGVRVDDDIDTKYKVIGSDICRLINQQKEK